MYHRCRSAKETGLLCRVSTECCGVFWHGLIEEEETGRVGERRVLISQRGTIGNFFKNVYYFINISNF